MEVRLTEATAKPQEDPEPKLCWTSVTKASSSLLKANNNSMMTPALGLIPAPTTPANSALSSTTSSYCTMEPSCCWKTATKYNYTDHMNDPDGDYVAANAILHRKASSQEGTSSSNSRSSTDQSFCVRLHYALKDIEADGLSHIIAWQPHGRCFVVHNQKLFVEKILGCWFRMSKYASFQRQLNIYGFQRLTAGPDKGAYYHELFLRSKPGLAYRIQRHKLKGTRTRKAAAPELEPDFYSMKSLPASNHNACSSKTTAAAPPAAASEAEQSSKADTGPMLVAPGSHGASLSTTSSRGVAGGVSCTLKGLAPMLFSAAPAGGTVWNTNQNLAVNHQTQFTPTQQAPGCSIATRFGLLQQQQKKQFLLGGLPSRSTLGLGLGVSGLVGLATTASKGSSRVMTPTLGLVHPLLATQKHPATATDHAQRMAPNISLYASVSTRAPRRASISTATTPATESPKWNPHC